MDMQSAPCARSKSAKNRNLKYATRLKWNTVCDKEEFRPA